MMNVSSCASFTFLGEGVDCANVAQCQANILLHPCCVGAVGDCFLLAEDHCDVLPASVYHASKTLCSQVDCLESACGMGGFLTGKPDQWFRLVTSMFIHGGLIHLLFNIVFQIKVVAEVEEFSGFWRTAVMYFISGIGGNIVSSIFHPNSISVGSSGALYGIIGVMTVDLFNTWQLIDKKVFEVLKLFVMLIVVLGIGTLHFIDNWAHCGGFFVGVLAGIAFLSYIDFGKWDGRRKFILRILAAFILCALGLLGVILFYETVDPGFCSWCHYIDCVPYTEGFCDDKGQ
eukprot:c20057_g1_i5.p2 GENE.c20057_g1_i5~~c20057_g1_i5.p2  ORF type:complete len:288 (+),score=54.93 c20057_g1_i5:1018-1881(+)